jgi:hypothetical protein
VITTLWQVELQNSHLGSHRPIYDSLHHSIYVSDGWGANYAEIRLRRLSLTDGRETKSVLLRSTPGCLYFHSDKKTLMVALGKRIAEIDRTNLRVLNYWTDDVPQYSQYINMIESKRMLLLMNWAKPTLSLYDLKNSARQKKKIGSCKGIFKINENDFLICSGKEGGIWLYSADNKHTHKILDTPQFRHAKFIATKSLLILALGNPYKISSNSVTHFNEFEKIRVCNIIDKSFKEYSTPAKYDYFETNDDCTIYYFSRKAGIDICVEKNGRLETSMSNNLPDNSEVISIVPHCSMILSATRNSQKLQSTLSGMKFDI